eukprot:UN24114
MTFKKIPMS